jgi:uncharacterized protein
LSGPDRDLPLGPDPRDRRRAPVPRANRGHAAVVVFGDFEWDDAKEAANITKHGVSFKEAASAFADKNYLLLEDPQGHHDRFVMLGVSSKPRVLFIVHIEIAHKIKRTRIISAREATKREARLYVQGA